MMCICGTFSIPSNQLYRLSHQRYLWYLWSLWSIADFILGNFEVSGMNGFFYNLLFVSCLQSLVTSIHEGLLYQTLDTFGFDQNKEKRSFSWIIEKRRKRGKERDGRWLWLGVTVNQSTYEWRPFFIDIVLAREQRTFMI